MLKYQRGFVGWAALAALSGTTKLILGGVLLVSILSTLGYVAYQIRDGGVRAERARLEPKLSAMQTARDTATIERQLALDANKRLVAAFEAMRAANAEKDLALEKLAAERAKAELELRKAIVRFAESEKRWTAEHKRLVAIATGPVITENLLEETDAILRALARDRLVVVR